MTAAELISELQDLCHLKGSDPRHTDVLLTADVCLYSFTDDRAIHIVRGIESLVTSPDGILIEGR